MRPVASGSRASRGASATGAAPAAGRSATGCPATLDEGIVSATTLAWPVCPSAGTLCRVLAEESLHLGHDRAGLAGFREVAVAPHFHRLLTVRRERVGGERDDGDVARDGIVLEDLGGFPSVD